MIKNKKNIEDILVILKSLFPETKTALRYSNPFELLIATILSAQCTDKQVNAVTPKLFNLFPTPLKLSKATILEIEELIRPTGFFHNKAKNIKNCSLYLVENYNGIVPNTLEELIKFPGVGRKTANVILGTVFGIPGIVVDTHVIRISNRLKLSENKDPTKIEFDLMNIIPREEWSSFSLRLIFLGRTLCKAQRPLCSKCNLYNLCEYPKE
ncbi:MAG: endonuclease III [Desulfobacterales bacterium]|nr:endonuclease III [Desulfobacterales bacterium]